MKNILATILLVAFANTSFAEELELRNVTSIIKCAETNSAIKQQRDFDSPPVVLGEAAIWDSEVGEISGTIVVWMNLNDKTFQITFTPSDNENTTCYMAYGQNMRRAE